VILVCLFLAGCGEAKVEVEKPGFITFTTARQYDLQFTILNSEDDFDEPKMININWGDGNIIEVIACLDTAFVFTHCYENRATHKITIIGHVANFNIEGMELLSLDVSDMPYLKLLTIDETNLNKANISKNEELVWFSAMKNRFSDIDVTGLPNLEWLNLNYNELTQIDLSKNEKLLWLHIRENKLNSLYVGKNTNLHLMDISINNFNRQALESLYDSMVAKEEENPGILFLQDNPGSSTAVKAILDAKHWNYNIY
jgi:Leucine-rich repeat (LRR) protein